MNQQANGTSVIAPPQFDAEYQQKLAEAAKEVQENERIEANYFSTKAGHLKFGQWEMPGNKVSVIVLSAMHENQWYEKPYDGNNPRSPDCWAFSESGKNMGPQAELVSKLQSTNCDACPKSQWGTAMKNGVPSKGKACKETRRLLLMSAGNAMTPESVANSTTGILRVPVMSVKNWSAYANKLALLSVPPFAAITEVALVPDQQSMFKVTFTLMGYVNDPAVLDAIMARIPADRLTLAAPYGKNDERDDPAPAMPAVAAGASKF